MKETTVGPLAAPDFCGRERREGENGEWAMPTPWCGRARNSARRGYG